MMIKFLRDNLFKLRTFFILPFFVSIFSNIHAQVADKVILSVANVSITKYEFEKNLNVFKSAFIRKNNSDPSSNDITEWIQSFIDHTYFLADAYHKGMDTLDEVNKRVASMEHLIISQPGGLLDRKMISEKSSVNQAQAERANIRTRYEKQVDKKAQITINSNVLLQLQSFLQKHGALHEFEKEPLSDLLQANILSYKSNDKLINVSVDQFISYYNYLPLKTEIKTGDDLAYYIKSMAFDYYAYKKAQEYGLTQESKFLLDKENYKKDIIYSLYEKKELDKGINVSDEEVKKRYDLNKSKFTQATDVDISTYYFKDRNKALLGMIRAKQGNFDINNLQGLEYTETHKSLNYQSNYFSDDIKSIIFDLKINEVSRPILINGKFMLAIIESESGERIKSLNEVKNFLIKEIRDEKLSKKKQACLSKLKSLYPIRNEIDYQKYLTSSK